MAEPGAPPLNHRAARAVSLRLLDHSVRTGVRPDSVQVAGGRLSLRLPTLLLGVALYIGLQPVGHRDEASMR
jgi:hypothetical protein